MSAIGGSRSSISMRNERVSIVSRRSPRNGAPALIGLSAFLSVFLCLCCFCQGSLAAPKVSRGLALVIGEASYRQLNTLQNPANDATSIAALLTKLGFEVATVLDFDTKRLRRKLQSFVKEAQGNDVALIYYSASSTILDMELRRVVGIIWSQSMPDLWPSTTRRAH
jgi:hypothetical protein